VDFISLDNASYDQFEDAQVAWIERVLARDETDANVRSVVVGMHDALPDSISTGHGMNESAQMERSGRPRISGSACVPQQDEEIRLRAGQPLALFD